jgi:phosphonate transport system substrate-binding protein
VGGSRRGRSTGQLARLLLDISRRFGMRGLKSILPVILLAVVALLVWLAQTPRAKQPAGSQSAPTTTVAPIRLGVVPERDLFAQQKRNKALADYLADRIGRPVILVTARSYQQILEDFETGEVDAAFLGSLLTVLALERADCRVLVRPELPDGSTTYRGVILVREDSPIRTVQDLANRRIMLVRMTTAGHLFPMSLLHEHGLQDPPKKPALIWVGTHDEVIEQLTAGTADAGAMKDQRLDAYLASHPDARVRRLATSEAVPENALVIRHQVGDEMARRIAEVLLAMPNSAEGREALAEFEVSRFVPCDTSDYASLYDMIDQVRDEWTALELTGRAPRRRPETLPTTPATREGH